MAYEAACTANIQHEETLFEMEFAINDGLDCVTALQQLVANIESTRISKIITAAQDLSRHSTNLVGGFPLPDFESDPFLYTEGNLALAILTNFLLMISSELEKVNSENGIDAKIHESPDSVDITFSANDLTQESWELVLDNMEQLITSEFPTFSIDLKGGEFIFNFRTLNSTPAEKR